MVTARIALDVTVDLLLYEAKLQDKGDYRTYSRFKRQLETLPLKQGEFQAAHRELIDILEV